MSTSYAVKVWQLQTRYATANGRRTPSRYVVRWQVDRERFEQSYRVRAQADSFRSDLSAAARRGEQFDRDKGLPVSMLRADAVHMTWLAFARAYVDMKWNDSAPKSRKSTADNLVAITRVILAGRRGEPSRDVIGAVLRREFNRARRAEPMPDLLRSAARWIEDTAPDVIELTEPATFRTLIGALERCHDGRRAAPDTIRLRRTTLRNALDYAVELRLIEQNPVGAIKVKRHSAGLREVDRRSVANPAQARALLAAVAQINDRLTAFFAMMYYAGLRPEEAVNVRRADLDLPTDGWGEVHLRHAAPEVAAEWTDRGAAGEERELKHRGVGVGRTVPCPPALAELLRAHLRAHGTAVDGRLFRAMRSDAPLSSSVYGRAWAAAREAALAPELASSPLARRPYDLRHAAVSTWLNATGDPTRVAEWAGHTVSVLLRVYAKCIDGGELDARKRVEERLRKA